MFTWILIILYSSLCASDPAYECGAHGKFEYCIDGIPGCVIGCHCHPGYYFDTDTKICEPNVKLSQDYRRRFMPFEPTRVQNFQEITLPPLETETTTKDAVDAKLDEITNDADDLGDWLYNQFFKTIENQVMNKTNDDKQILTRRSGVQVKKPVRRSHKHMRSKKPKKPKKQNLRSKLLRITEDDSLFHSSSESGDDSSDSASSDLDTDTSDDVSRKRGRGKKKKDNDRGGHRKIVIFNKKPRPPLPSFIFLPNMDTPFFPPIGLPPPPVPMYPMIPVPPVVAPMYPYPLPPVPPVTPDLNNVTNGAPAPTTTPAPNIEKQPPEMEEAPVPEEDPSHVPEKTEQQETPLIPESPKIEDNVLRSRPTYRARSRTKGGPLKNKTVKNKLLQLQKLRQKMLRQKKIDNYLAEHQMEPDLEENLPANEIPSSDPMKVNLERPQAVDFKYLTELIHKMDPNGTARGNLVNALANTVPVPGQVPIGTGASADALIRKVSYNLGQASNQDTSQFQNLMVKNNTRRHRVNMDDSYYADLGKQIASMIKNIDMTNNHHIDVEIEPRQETPLLHPVFNENSYGARSYWERSIRSPLKYVGTHNENFSEEHLFNLEDKVQTAASTVRTLNLHELETIIFKMNQPKQTQQKANMLPTHLKNIVIEPARVMFNLDNIMPKNNITNLIKTAETKVTTETPDNSLKSSTLKYMFNPDALMLSNMRNFNHFTTLEPQVIFNNPYFFQPTREPNAMPVIESKSEQPIHNIDQSRYNLDQARYNQNQLRYNQNQLGYNTNQVNYNTEQSKYNVEQARYHNNQVPPFNFPIPTPSPKYPGHNPFVNAYTNNLNMTKIRYNIKPPSYNLSPNIYYYSSNNKNNYVFEKPALPINLQSLTRKVKPFIKKFEPYSYFQNQFQHQFDNVDDF